MSKWIENTISFNRDCFKYVSPILNTKVNEGFDLFGIEYLSINFCYRMIHSLKTLNLILPKFKDNGYHSSIALVLRPSLLDLITFAYVLTRIEKDEVGSVDLPKSLIQSIYIDNLKNFFEELKSIKSVGDYSFEQYKTTTESVYNQFGNLFKEFEFKNNTLNYEFVISQKLPTTRKMYRLIKSCDELSTRNMANCYHEYCWFSKYEHFGLLTVMLMNSQGETLKALIMKSCKNIARGTYSGLLFLGDSSDKLENRINNFEIV